MICLSDSQLRSLVHRTCPSGTLRRAWPLEGGISNEMTAVEIGLTDGGTERVVVRQFGTRATSAIPDIAKVEFRLLHLLEQESVPAPRPIYLDADGELSGAPLIVTSWVDGTPDLSGIDGQVVCEELASYLARLHTCSSETNDLSFLPALDARLASMLDAASHDDSATPTVAAIRDALEPIWPWPPTRPGVVLHGDFWPGNMMWRDGHLVAAVDWEDAVCGDPLFDLASVRLELLWLFGEREVRTFTERYLTITEIDPSDLPRWDLCAALDPAIHLSTWHKPPELERHMHAELARFVDRARVELTRRIDAGRRVTSPLP